MAELFNLDKYEDILREASEHLGPLALSCPDNYVRQALSDIQQSMAQERVLPIKKPAFNRGKY